VRSETDALDKLAQLLGTTRAELVRAIVRASSRDWQRELKRQLRRQLELPDQDQDLWDPDTPE
jgi:ubiquinone biosynthesis protein UbiJ